MNDNFQIRQDHETVYSELEVSLHASQDQHSTDQSDQLKERMQNGREQVIFNPERGHEQARKACNQVSISWIYRR